MQVVNPSRGSRPSMSQIGARKLSIEKYADGGIACLKLAGTIDEGFEGKNLGQTASGDVLLVDLGEVKKISSFGIREWVDFVSTAGKQVKSLILIECAPKVVDQLNMVANFAGGGRVYSFYAPFRCDYCDSEHRVLLQVDKDLEAIKSMKLADRPCPACNEAMYFDEDGATFFSYILGQPRFELPPEVAQFLGAKLSYAVPELNRKLRVDKLIDGRTTFLRLVGDLDASFPRDKLADGLEGIAIVDLASIGRIEPAGAAHWRAFVQMVTPLVDQLLLAAAPPAFLEKLGTTDDLGPKAQVVSLTLPYTCKSCGLTSSQLVDVAAHYDVLKFATAPELRCQTCNVPMQPAASEALMALLPTLPQPTASPDLVKSIGILRERAQAPSRPPSIPATPVPGAAANVIEARSSFVVPFLAALLALVLAAGGFLIYQRLTATTAPAVPAIIERSAAARPAWITADTTSCTESKDRGLSCVGVSSASARQDDAEDEAAHAAYEAVANAIALRIDEPGWKATVPAIYQASRDAKLGTLDRAPTLTTARRDVREARAAVTQSLLASAAGIVPPTPSGRYWELVSDPDGKRYTAFAQVIIGPTELAKLVALYGTPHQALGATVVTTFPLVAWRHPKVERGAIVTTLESGPLQDLGLDEGYIVLSVAGRDVPDAATFAQVVPEEHVALSTRGGTLRLKVQTSEPAPREYAKQFEISPVEATEGSATKPSTPKNPTVGPAAPTGGVNVWDRYDRKPSRDDPTQ